MDEFYGDSQVCSLSLSLIRHRLQIITSTIVGYLARRVFVFSPNNTLCSVYCLPPNIATALPQLQIAANNSEGVTYDLSSHWLRLTTVSPLTQRTYGVYNASVSYVVRSLGNGLSSPVSVGANYSFAGSTLSSLRCDFESFNPYPRFAPTLFSPPSSCFSVTPRHCYAPLRYIPYPVAQGCFYAESLPIFGAPHDDTCSCGPFDSHFPISVR